MLSREYCRQNSMTQMYTRFQQLVSKQVISLGFPSTFLFAALLSLPMPIHLYEPNIASCRRIYTFTRHHEILVLNIFCPQPLVLFPNQRIYIVVYIESYFVTYYIILCMSFIIVCAAVYSNKTKMATMRNCRRCLNTRQTDEIFAESS